MDTMDRVLINDSASTLRILRTLPNEKAFYFYFGIGRPANLRARSLEEFVERLNEVDFSSVEFHLGRGDFERWVGMLGDQSLVQSYAELRNRRMSAEEAKHRLLEITGSRVSRLRKLEH
jgi:hypothetical protein